MTDPAFPITIWHNPACGTSRNVVLDLLDRRPERFTKEDGEVVDLA